MEAPPLCLDKIVPEYLAVIISVTAVLIFGEVIPQAICTGPDQVKIAAGLAPITRFLMIVLSPICYPIALLLDKLLGEHTKSRFLNTDLKALIELHTYNALRKYDLMEGENINKPNELGLNDEQANLMISAIEMNEKKTIEIMIPISKAFLIDYDEPIDAMSIKQIIDKGYSRIPVYSNHNKSDIIGVVRIKQLIGIDLTRKKTMRQMGIKLKSPIVASPKTSLVELLREFKKGMSHIAFITEQVEGLQSKFEGTTNQLNLVKKPTNKENIKILGIITLEDVIEKMINLDILDEDDYARLVKKTVTQGTTAASMNLNQGLLSKFIIKIKIS
jgi:metal transporter CNNM